MTITRTKDGIRIKTNALTDEIIKKVKDSLPPQPWPKGVSKSVADKLELPHELVSEAIQKLIRKGTFYAQIDGRLYMPKTSVVKKKLRDREKGEV